MKTTSSQATDTLLMIRPSQFSFNGETSATNIFQQKNFPANQLSVQQNALREFDALVANLREKKIYVIVLQDHEQLKTPDSIFPNNWISFHDDAMILYPMLAPNRRLERRTEWIQLMKDELHFKKILDLTSFEQQEKFLEGTGSLVLDRINRIAYANLSSRTNQEVLHEFAKRMNYEVVCFIAKDTASREIYHTNVLMAIGEKTAVICSEAIVDKHERTFVLKKLSEHHHVIEISFEQMMKFAGNMLLVKNRDGENFWVMSEQAFQSLTSLQVELLKQDGDFISSKLETIESIGGGSARCMMCEVFSNQ